MQVMRRLIRLLVKVFADVFAFIPGMAVMTAAFVCLVFIQQPTQALAEDCYDCARGAVLTNCTAFDPANCYRTMSDETGRPTTEGLAAFHSNIFCRLAEQCSACSNCFHFQKLQSEMLDWQSQNSDIMNIGSGWSFPEYAFKVDFVSGLSPEEVHPINGRPVVSRLTVEMYFLGEQEELVHHWTALGTLNTDRSGQTTGSGLNRQLKKLIHEGTPYNVLAWSFEKKPDQCRVEPEKEEVREGEEIDIILSDFRDALQQPSREFNRILVHAHEGKILNGARCRCAAGPDYRVFRLDEQPITVRYRAPKNGDANSDKITVYNSCEILPLEKSPLRATSPHEEIASRELRLPHYTWKGSLNLEATMRFQCNGEEKTSQSSSRRLIVNDEETQRANVTISMDDFDLTQQPVIPGTIRDASGEANFMISEDHLWISPDEHETISGQASHTIKKGNITLDIVKDMELNKEAMQNLQQQMQGDQNNNVIPIRIHILIVFDPTKTHLITITDDSGSRTFESAMVPMGAVLKGTYIRGKDGRDTITATVNMTGTLPGQYPWMNCPDATTTVSGQINLERKRK